VRIIVYSADCRLYNIMTNITEYDIHNNTQLPDTYPTTVFDQPMIRYFSITAAIAFVALIMLIIYCIIAYIERKRVLLADRRTYATIQMTSQASRKTSRTMMNNESVSSTRQTKFMPLIWRFGRRN
jgi:hypothetical protein